MALMLSGLLQTVGDKLGFAHRGYPMLPANELAEATKVVAREEQRTVPIHFSAATGFAQSLFMREASKFRPVKSASDLKLNHSRIRLAARVSYFDSLLLHSMVERLSDVVVADGIRLECTPKADLLGLSPEALDDWSRSTEDKFDEFMRSKSFSVDAMSTGYQAQRLASTQQHRDGEYFARLHYLPEGLRVGFLDPDQIVSGTTQSGKYHDGVIIGPKGEATGYNVRKPDGTTVVIPAFTGSRRPLILHGIMPTFAGQTRGLSRIAHCLEEADRLVDYETAELYAAAAQSQLAGQVVPSKDAPSSGAGLDDFANSAMPPVVQNQAESPVAATDTQLPAYSELAETSSRRPGAVLLLGNGAGEKFETIRKTSPTLVYPAFFESIAQYIAASNSVPLSIIKMLFSENYSASRGELQLFWKVVQIWRAEMVSDFLAPLFEQWLFERVASGDVSCPGFSDPKLRAAWLSHTWYGSALPQLDPNKQAMADKVYVEMGATTLKRVAHEYNGSNAVSNRAALRRELSDLTSPPWSKSNG